MPQARKGCLLATGALQPELFVDKLNLPVSQEKLSNLEIGSFAQGPLLGFGLRLEGNIVVGATAEVCDLACLSLQLAGLPPADQIPVY